MVRKREILHRPTCSFTPAAKTPSAGYGRGEAAPRGTTGQFLPAKAITVVNLELEQALTSKWSAVGFTDALGGTESLAHYPFDYRLYSVGAGVRYNTIIGPIRLEYGRNLNPRPHDPGGTILFSVGFPF